MNNSPRLAQRLWRRIGTWLGIVSVASCSVPSSPPVEPGARPALPPAPAAAPAKKPDATIVGVQPIIRTAAELRRHAAQRLVAANPGKVYLGKPPDPLLAIPVLEIELLPDGHIRHIEVLRRPSQAQDTIQLAIDAVKRAAPFGDLRHMHEARRFTETFLFDDDRRFKPRTLD